MESSKQVVFITGATSGIGFAICKRYLEAGFFVIINYFKGGNLQDATNQLQKEGYKEGNDYLLFKADIGNEAELILLLETIPREIITRVEIIINNAAMLKRSSVKELEQRDWIDIFNVNVFAIIFLSKWFSKNSKNLQHIVNIGSIRGDSAITRVQNAAYSISKSTIPALTALLAKTYGPEVCVNAIIPGTIDTPQRQGVTPEEQKNSGEEHAILKRLGEPEEIAELCVFITSSRVKYITGSSIIVDGGYSINYIH